MIAHFINRTGYQLSPTTKPGVFEFSLVTPRLTWIEEDGGKWEPDQHFLTDGMSGGWLVSAFIHCTTMQFVGPYFHDSAYRHGGLWLGGVFVEMTKLQIDWLLARMIAADGGRWSQAIAVYVGLQTPVSWYVWHRYRKADEQPEPPANDLEQIAAACK
jgi:hypothetical protein